MNPERKDIFFEIHQGLPREGPGRNKYTERAFRVLPKMENPRILDIGCGPGGPTMELARLSGGEVIGLDTHQPYLDELQKKIERERFTDRVRALEASMFNLDFPGEHFDIIWAEGAIYIIGFEKGLKEWRRLIKPHGFLVVHEMCWLEPNPPKEIYDYWMAVYPGIMTIPDNLELIPDCGYRVIGHFPLPDDAWWVEYYGPLEKRLKKLWEKYKDDREALAVIHEEQREIDLYRKYHAWYGSVFFILQKE
jgi:SAM-dependent methyltransferase